MQLKWSKNLALLLVVCLSVLSLKGQSSAAKKPTIMVVPSDIWCNKNNYTTEFNNQGKINYIADYRKALIENIELHSVISKIGELMTERGFPLKDLEQELKSLDNENAESAVISSKSSGANIAEDPIDKLRRVAKADIILSITWEIRKENGHGPKNYIYFDLQGIDSYTNKQIAATSGGGQPTFSNDPVKLLEEAILNYLDNFNNNLQKYFDGIIKNGREITLSIKTFDNQIDLEEDLDGQELNEIIEDWVSQNVSEGQTFNVKESTAKVMLFEQVRIPLFDPKNNRAIDARGWTRGLQKLLKDKYKIDSKLMVIGLGKSLLIIGEK